MSRVTLEDIQKSPQITAFIRKANDNLGVLGYTEHGFRHIELVANLAYNILSKLGFSLREAELSAIAGYLHDIGNMVGRSNHYYTGALIAFQLLKEMQLPDEELAEVVTAIGNHDEEDGKCVSTISASLILADKSDVHRNRVRNMDFSTFDIHDRVNYAVKSSRLDIDSETRMITLDLKIDTEISQVMEYFEIFLMRMMMCRRAAEFLQGRFSLIINEARLL